ncbi:hypothetical protein BJ170DRAFT_686850 [Xylariales sp. AK1849]|nr:hypothetical protein BJ170DRAFT_686850 [Xylariales sp. AK1849]
MPVTSTPPLTALTTVFTPPCSTSWLLTTTKVPSQYPPFPTNGPSSCDPPFWGDNLEGRGFQYYSPAICPGGFVVGPSCDVTKTRTSEGFPAVQSSETVAYCVPSGQTCTTDTTDFRGGVWGFTRAGVTPTIVTVGPALQIRWRDEDLSILETHPLTPGLLLAAASTSTPEETIVVTTSVASTTLVATLATQTAASIPGFSTIIVRPTTPTPLIQSNGLTTSQSPSSVTSEEVTSDSKSTVDVSTSPLSSSSSGTLSTTSPSTNYSGSIHAASIAAVALSSSLIAIILAILLFLFIRRYRRIQRGQLISSLPVGIGVWLRRDRVDARGGTSPEVAAATTILTEPDLGLVGGIVIAEVDSESPVGSKENPAELDGMGVAVASRLSWMSRLSRLWGSRSRRAAGESVTTASSARWTRSAASEITSSSGRFSGDWETFAKEKWPSGLTVPPVITQRALPDLPNMPTAQRSDSYLKVDVNKTRLSRISDGTFGVADRSPVSEKSNRP